MLLVSRLLPGDKQLHIVTTCFGQLISFACLCLDLCIELPNSRSGYRSLDRNGALAQQLVCIWSGFQTLNVALRTMITMHGIRYTVSTTEPNERHPVWNVLLDHGVSRSSRNRADVEHCTFVSFCRSRSLTRNRHDFPSTQSWLEELFPPVNFHYFQNCSLPTTAYFSRPL